MSACMRRLLLAAICNYIRGLEKMEPRIVKEMRCTLFLSQERDLQKRIRATEISQSKIMAMTEKNKSFLEERALHSEKK